MNISIIIPVYNEEELILKCLNSILNLDYPKENFEVIIVNDGSTDKTKENVEIFMKENKSLKVRLINQENRGRALAREVGAKNAIYENLMFIDSRCEANKDLLKNLINKKNYTIIGNAIMDESTPLGRFGMLIRRNLYKDSFGHFKPIEVNHENFDRVSKGAILSVKKTLFLSAELENKESKHNSDDIRLLLNLMKHSKLLKDPSIKVIYTPRSSIKEHLAHTYNRGPKFIDYYFKPQKKYFYYVLLLVFGVSLGLLLVIVHPISLVYIGLFGILGTVIISFKLAENIKDFTIVLFFLPLTTIAFCSGVVKGLILKLLRLY